MLVYDFSFAPDYAGQSARVVVHGSDVEVAGSPITLDALGNGSLALAEGIYEARTGNVDRGQNNAVQTGVLNVPASIAAGGGGGGTDRGTLYLKASGTGLSLATGSVATGDGTVLGYQLDTAKGPLPSWASQVEGGFTINEFAPYTTAIAVKGTARYPSGVPTLVYIDVYDTTFSGPNIGHSSDGTDDSPAFTPAEVTPLDLIVIERTATFLGNPRYHDFPRTMHGLTCDNSGDQAADATLDLEVRLAISQAWAGKPYTEADFA